MHKKSLFSFVVLFFAASQLLVASEIKWDPTKTSYIPDDGNTYFLSTNDTILVTQDITIDGILEIRAQVTISFKNKEADRCSYTCYNNGMIIIKNNHTLTIAASDGSDGTTGRHYHGCTADFYNNGALVVEKGALLEIASGAGGKGGNIGTCFKHGDNGGDGGQNDFYNKGTITLQEKAVLKIKKGTNGHDGKGSIYCQIGSGAGGEPGQATLHHFGLLIMNNFSVLEIENAEFTINGEVEVPNQATLKINGEEVPLSWFTETVIQTKQVGLNRSFGGYSSFETHACETHA